MHKTHSSAVGEGLLLRIDGHPYTSCRSKSHRTQSPPETINKHMNFMIDFTTQSPDLSRTLKRAVSGPEYFENLENELEECHHMRDSMEYELKRITLEEYKDRLEKAREAQLNRKKI